MRQDKDDQTTEASYIKHILETSAFHFKVDGRAEQGSPERSGSNR
jgi:hypothetical protein